MSVIVSDMTVHREWAIYEKRSELVCAPLAVVTPRTVSLTSGDKIPRHRVWLIVQEESTPLVVEAKAYAASMDIDILWRAAAGRSLDAATLAACVNAEGNVGTLAVVQKIINNPAYFYRNSGVFQPAAAEVLEKAKAALCRRASDAKEEEQLLTELSAGRIPQEVAAAAVNLLMRKNKNTSIFKAVKKAAGGEQHIAEYLVKIGLFADARSCWEAMFIHNWPAPSTEDKVSLPALPFSSARAFSVDDAGTIEVDDAFSVQAEGSGWLIGLHIAVPAMAPLSVGDYETMRLTSVYFPDVKHPMLSSEQIEAYSLHAGCYCPTLSLYCHFNPTTGNIGAPQTRLEKVFISHNFALENFEQQVPAAVRTQYEVLCTFAAHLPSARREDGTRLNYRISTNPPGVIADVRSSVSVVVEKLMRYVNSVWAKQLYKKGGLFRANGVTITRPSSTKPYAWLSSPLRRYVDLANQRLLLFLLGQAPSPAVNWPKLAKMFNVQYVHARYYQDQMERHWVLRALADLPANTVLKAQLLPRNRIRLEGYPLCGTLNPPASGVLDETIEVRVRDLDFFAQRAYFAPV